MVDFHSHILPCIDDGSQSVEESVELLAMLSEQGVETVVATPHFFAERESIEDFLKRRQSSYEALCAELPQGMPKIVLGAEVKYYNGICHLEDLRKLCVGNSNMLLLELPMSKWTEYTVREVIDLSNSKGITVVLAHIDRYLAFQDNDVWGRFLESGILFQVNASFFTERRSRRKAFSLIKNNSIHFLGSDCHRILTRPPYIGQAVEIIEKKLGEEFVALMTEYASSMLA